MKQIIEFCIDCFVYITLKDKLAFTFSQLCILVIYTLFVHLWYLTLQYISFDSIYEIILWEYIPILYKIPSNVIAKTEIYIQTLSNIVYQNWLIHQRHKFLVSIHSHVIGYSF